MPCALGGGGGGVASQFKLYTIGVVTAKTLWSQF